MFWLEDWRLFSCVLFLVSVEYDTFRGNYFSCLTNYFFSGRGFFLILSTNEGVNSRNCRKNQTTGDVRFALTLADRPWVWVVPGAVGLAANDPLTPVVISRVTYEHHYRVILVLSPIDQPPSAVLHGRVADVGAGHRWKVRG